MLKKKKPILVPVSYYLWNSGERSFEWIAKIAPEGEFDYSKDEPTLGVLHEDEGFIPNPPGLVVILLPTNFIPMGVPWDHLLTTQRQTLFYADPETAKEMSDLLVKCAELLVPARRIGEMTVLNLAHD